MKAKESPYKVSDAEGLFVFVSPSGSRLWRLAYRYLGKQKTLALGQYPAVTLFEARRVRDEARKLLAKGKDPSAAKRADRMERVLAANNSFETVANEWFEIQKERWVETYSARLRSRLDEDLLPSLGKRPIAELEPLEILETIRKIEGRGAIEMAKRIMQMASAIFRYGIATARCRRDPTADLKGALKPPKAPKHRTALPPTELPMFMKSLAQYDGDIVTRLALTLVVLTFVRTAELRFARWSEFEGLDGREPLWRISGERMKMMREHLVPLPPQAVDALHKLRRITGKSTYLFPASTKCGVMSENTLLFALYRMGYHSRATVHGFRSMASTILNEAQFNRDWIEMQLAHRDGTVRGIYNAAEWLPGRREMMKWWGDHVSSKSVRPRLAA